MVDVLLTKGPPCHFEKNSRKGSLCGDPSNFAAGESFCSLLRFGWFFSSHQNERQKATHPSMVLLNRATPNISFAFPWHSLLNHLKNNTRRQNTTLNLFELGPLAFKGKPKVLNNSGLINSIVQGRPFNLLVLRSMFGPFSLKVPKGDHL